MDSRVCSEKSLWWDGDIFFSAGVMIVGMEEVCPIGLRAAHRREGQWLKPED